MSEGATAPIVTARDAANLSARVAQAALWIRLAGYFCLGLALADVLASARSFLLSSPRGGVKWLLDGLAPAAFAYLLLVVGRLALSGPASQALPRLAVAIRRQNGLWLGCCLVVLFKVFFS